MAWTDLLQLGTGNSSKPGFWKVWFSFLFHYECIALKSINVFKIYEDRCINNFESVGLSVFVSPAPRCSSAMAWPYLALVLPGTCSPEGVSRDFLWGCVVADPWRKHVNRKSESWLLLSERYVRFLYVGIYLCKEISRNPPGCLGSLSCVSGIHGHSNRSLDRTHQWIFLNICKCEKSPEQPSVNLCVDRTLISQPLQKTVTSTLLMLTAK